MNTCETKKALTRLRELLDLLDQLPDPDQPEFDLRREYLGWLTELDVVMKQ
jgi:hypothetical protein